jgi:hypothetical protein
MRGDRCTEKKGIDERGTRKNKNYKFKKKTVPAGARQNRVEELDFRLCDGVVERGASEHITRERRGPRREQCGGDLGIVGPERGEPDRRKVERREPRDRICEIEQRRAASSIAV